MHTRLIQAYSKVSKVTVPKPGYLTVLNEENIYKNKNQLTSAILDTNPSFKSGGTKAGAIRIAPSGEETSSSREDIVKDFENTLKDINLVIKDIKPRGEGASSKYPTYVVSDAASNEYQIVLAGGSASNLGMKYERELLKSLKDYFSKLSLGEEVDKPKFLKDLEDKTDLEFVDVIDEVDFTRRVKRPLSDDGAEDKGKEIADIALKGDDDNTYYISLKDVGGITVANTGAAGMFNLKDDKITFVDRGDKIGKKLFNAAGLDDSSILKVERGLTDYLKKTVSPSELQSTEDVTTSANKEDLKKFLYSAFDYGYIYVRRKPVGLEVVDLTKEKDLKAFIGDVKSVKVKYPFYRDETRTGKRKNVSIVIETEHNVFSFDIRNASGGVIPSQINLVKLGSKKDIAQTAANVDSVKTSDKSVEDVLSKYNL
jgi:hypothetical protein